MTKDAYDDINLEIGAYIINLQDSNDGYGTHWTALVIFNRIHIAAEKKLVIYFDSYGIAIPQDIIHFIGRFPGKLTIKNSIDQIQTINQSLVVGTVYSFSISSPCYILGIINIKC